MLCYCDKCGNICEAFRDELSDGCYCCGNSLLKPIPREYIDNFRWRDGDGKQAFIEEVIKKSPNLDKRLFEQKNEVIQQKNDDMITSISAGKAILEERARVPKCPSCGSSNISKIGVFGRAGAFRLVGFASSKIGKTHKCNHCGTTW